MSPYLHSVPGRLRIKIPVLQNCPLKVSQVYEFLSNMDGVEDIRINSLTGSVVLKYVSEKTTTEEILDRLRQIGIFDPGKAVDIDRHIHQAASKAGERFGKAVFGWAVGKALEANGLSFLAAFI